MEVAACITCSVNPNEPFFFSTIIVRRRRSSSGLLAVTRSGFTRSRICDCKNKMNTLLQNQTFQHSQNRNPPLDTDVARFHPPSIVTFSFLFWSSNYYFSKIFLSSQFSIIYLFFLQPSYTSRPS